MPRWMIAALFSLLLPSNLMASNGLKDPKALGSASFSWFGLTLYQAELFTQGSAEFAWGQPLSLRLNYKRSFSKAKLLDATRIEMERLEGRSAAIATLMDHLSRCYRGVTAGDTITATAPQADQMILYVNDSETCRISEPGVQKRFLGIWLSPQSRSAKLSQQLRGE